MCKWNTITALEIDGKLVDVDSCIAAIVKSLNDSGVKTIASCCGHGKRPGRISLVDGREIFIAPDYDSAQKTDEFFNTIGFVPIT